MIVKRFCAENFRNIEKCDISFSPGINLLHGKNAQGKTNALEGIYIFSRGRSFRTSDEKELVKNGAEGFRIFIEYEDSSGDGSLEYAFFGRERRRKKNGYKISKVTEMIGSFKTVLFSPDDLKIIKDGPEERRSFLNIAASQCFPSYLKLYADYKKALENRNCILKNAKSGFYFDIGELNSWSETMAEYASYIYKYRKEYLKSLDVYSKEIQYKISDGKEELSLFYKSGIDEELEDKEDIKKAYISLLNSSVEREIAAGVTLFGVHRDDIEININGENSRSFASQGQQRSAVLSLKLAEGEVNRAICGEYPVYLLDDVLSELDEKRRTFVINGIKEKQVIITSCENDENMKFADSVTEVVGGNYVSSRG
ncbi:MAG: DNA replication/repair protein RecF [Clostridia bacterium]|nr:DNA replication/repair protein RecF [Clostridia bacterium]